MVERYLSMKCISKHHQHSNIVSSLMVAFHVEASKTMWDIVATVKGSFDRYKLKLVFLGIFAFNFYVSGIWSDLHFDPLWNGSEWEQGLNFNSQKKWRFSVKFYKHPLCTWRTTTHYRPLQSSEMSIPLVPRMYIPNNSTIIINYHSLFHNNCAH